MNTIFPYHCDVSLWSFFQGRQLLEKQLPQLKKLEVCSGLAAAAAERHQPRTKQLAESASYMENFAPPPSSGFIYYYSSSPLAVQEQKTITYVVYISE
jgi:hypothetical protein